MSDKLSRYTFVILFFGNPFLLTSSAFCQEASSEPAVSFDRMWIDYNAIRDNEIGMLIHVSLTVRQLKDVLVNLGLQLNWKMATRFLRTIPNMPVPMDS